MCVYTTAAPCLFKCNPYTRQLTCLFTIRGNYDNVKEKVLSYHCQLSLTAVYLKY